MPEKIAVVGAGIAGCTVASQLARQGHCISLFEQAEKLRPVGAGFLLQPSGQRVLNKLGLLRELQHRSARIHSLRSEKPNGRTLVKLTYGDLHPSLYGLGVHRGDLFAMLYDQCSGLPIQIISGAKISRHFVDRRQAFLRDENGSSFGPFDFVVACDGSRSALRKSSGIPARVSSYRYAAIYSVASPKIGNRQWLPTDFLYQKVAGTKRLLGILPLGQNRFSFFWGAPAKDFATIKSAGTDALRNQVVEFCAVAEPFIEQIHSWNDVAFTTYRDVRMSCCIGRRIAFLGDAAHGSSPHLGQGVNLALCDALTFSDAVAECRKLSAAAAKYERIRRRTNRFYSQLSRLLSPFFQSGSITLGILRDIGLPWLGRIPPTQRQMLLSLCGLKTGWLSHAPIDEWVTEIGDSNEQIDLATVEI